MPQLLVIQNNKSKINQFSGKEYTISYALASRLEFKEDHFARLVFLSGTKNIVLVFADFVRGQDVNGVLEPYLGSSATASLNSWVPLANNSVPSHGLLHIRNANLTPLAAGRKITLVIEIASKSWIDGAKSSTLI